MVKIKTHTQGKCIQQLQVSSHGSRSHPKSTTIRANAPF